MTTPPSDFEEFVPVPVDGDFLIRNGKVFPIVEVELKEYTDEYWGWMVWVERESVDE